MFVGLVSASDNNDINISHFEALERKLNKCKSQMDNLDTYQYKGSHKLTFSYEIMQLVKQKQYITNAYLKLWEILHYFSDTIVGTKKNILHFDNASFPGTWIRAVSDFCLKHNISSDYRASSLISSKKKAFLDDYGYFRKEPEKWWMENKEDEGDMSNISCVSALCKKMEENTKFDLYTSDLGIEHENQHGQFEKLNIAPQIGQLLAGLYALNIGGCMIVKHYNIFLPISVSLVQIMYNCFDKVYVVKPATSKPINDEKYFVCVGYLGLNHEYVKLLLVALRQTQTSYTDFLLPCPIISSLYKNEVKLVNKQCFRLNTVEIPYYRGKKTSIVTNDNQSKAPLFIKNLL